MISVSIELRIDPARREEFLDGITLQAQRTMEREPGCVRFEVGEDRDDPTHFSFHEVYVDPEALESHRETAYFPSWQAIAGRCVTERRETVATVLVALPNADAESAGL